jgi:hypothetical protein
MWFLVLRNPPIVLSSYERECTGGSRFPRTETKTYTPKLTLTNNQSISETDDRGKSRTFELCSTFVDNITNVKKLCLRIEYEFLLYERQTSTTIDSGLSDHTSKVYTETNKLI